MLPALLLLAATAASPTPTLSPASPEATPSAEKAFRRIERELYGPDVAIREACKQALVAIDDRPLEANGVVERRTSDVRMRGATPVDVRECVRAVARAGFVDGWSVKPAEDADAFDVDVRLIRERRDPKTLNAWRRAADDKAAAAALTSLAVARKPAVAALAAEVIAPDVVELDEATLNGGNVSISGSVRDASGAAAYKAMLAPLLGDTKVDWQLDERAAPPEPAPPMPDAGTLRAVARGATSQALLRLFAELDRRDYVAPAEGPRKAGAIAGGWEGLVAKTAGDLHTTPIHVGRVDVLAPPGAKEPPIADYDGKPIDFELQAADPAKLFTLLGVVGGARMVIDGVDSSSPEAPAMAPLDVELVHVPWDEALAAVAAATGCTVKVAERERDLGCGAVKVPRAAVASSAAAMVVTSAGAPASTSAASGDDAKTPLERYAAWRLHVVALGCRNGNGHWRAIVETPDGLDAVVQTGTVMGLEGGRAFVDEHGVALTLERFDGDGNGHLAPIPLAF